MNMTQRSMWVAAGCAVVLWASGARAVEPVPDWVTLIFPTMVPKAGNPNTVPTSLETSLIRYSYETRFEGYWKESSYYAHDVTTGAKTQGAYSDTKTYGYIQVPWPIKARASMGTFAAGTGLSDTFNPETNEGDTGDGARGIGTPNRRYSSAAFNNLFYTFVYDPADRDNVWTAGESFNDADNDGQWDAPTPAEDYWDSDHTTPMYGVPTTYNPRNNDNQYSATGGEMFADYNGSASYNSAVAVWLYVAGTANTRVTVNEMDFSPTTVTPFYEGDFQHTLVSDPDMPGNLPVVPGATYTTNIVGVTTNIAMVIPRNNLFNYTTDADGNTQWAATGSYIEFDAYVVPDAASETAGFYQYSAAVKAGGPYAGTQYSNAVLRTVRVQLYAARELYGTLKTSSGTVQIFGELRGPNNAQQYPARRIANANDDVWTAAVAGEAFEDFLSVYDPARGGQCYVTCPADLEGNTSVKRGNELANGSENTRGRGLVMAYATYTNYLAWNYPGAFTSLMARAFNGRYDGPDDWTDVGSSGKWTWDERAGSVATATEPTPAVANPVTGGIDWSSMSPGGGWDPRSGYATWTDWYTAVFGAGITPAPAWRGGIPRITRYTPSNARGADGWIPTSSWTFDSPAEYCDLPSSIYHLNGSYLNGNTLLLQRGGAPADLFVYAWTNALLIGGGDRKLGEVTSPFGDEIWGQDIAGPMAGFWGAADGTIPAAGPYCFNTVGGHGYDACEQVNLEFLTHRRSGLTRDVDTHPAFLRDTNLDGYLDGGRELQGDPNYSSGQGTTGAYGTFTWHRFMEDVIGLWDQEEDFAQVLMRSSIPLMYAYPIYPVATNEGWAALGGPSGQVRPFISRDTNAVLSMTFQVRPLNGGGESPGSNGNFAPDPTFDPTANPAAQDFGMALLTHEQGHDMMAWPDLYDYDVWGAGSPMINAPVAGYDLMAGGGLVHGFPILKEQAMTGGPWTLATDIDTLVPLDAGPVTLELYPIERHDDQYLMLINPNKDGEYLDLWYTDNNTDYGVVGGRGVYIDHLDLAQIHNALPVQQKVNNHFTYEMIQADGRTDLQDGMNFGDTGDPFPGTVNQRTFSADTLPASRWWDSTDTGFRILNIVLPATGSDLPALVTVERFTTTNPWSYNRVGADTDNDGILDAWEYHYFHGLAIVNGTSDYDLDGLPDIGEYYAKTDPTRQDSDNNGTSDALEDSDSDGLNNRDEMVIYHTDPGNIDSDDDSLTDGYEVSQVVFDPRNSLSPWVSRALRFVGAANSYMELNNPVGDTRFNSGSLTAEAWVSPTADIVGAGGTIYSRTWFAPGPQSITLGVTSNARPFVAYDTGASILAITNPAVMPIEAVVPNPPFATNWTHLAAAYDGNTRLLKLFVNGTLVSNLFNISGSVMTNGNDVVQRVGEDFRGLIDEVHIWNRSVTPSMVGLTGTETNLAGYYRMDDFTYGTAGVDGLWGTVDDTAPLGGQVEDFVFRNEWSNGWQHAASLYGNVAYFTNKFLQFPVLGEDSDGDGAADAWENLYPGFMDPLVSDSHRDSDYDGWSNESEFLASVQANGTYAATPSPVNATQYPEPTVQALFKYTGTRNTGQLVINAFRTAAMDGDPDATQIIPAAQVPANFPATVTWTGWTSNYLREGTCYLYAFRDQNNNETWDAGEPFGLCEENPVQITWNLASLTFGLRDTHPGYQRFAWPAVAGVNQYRVEIQTAGGGNIVNRLVTGRRFFHEGDYQYAGLWTGLSESSTYQYNIYSVPVGGAPFANGNFQVLYSGSNLPSVPVPALANGTLIRASQGEVAFICDTNAVRYEVQLYGPTGALVYARSGNVPVAGFDGTSRVTVPLYASGTYSWRARAFNVYAGAGTAWSEFRTIVADLATTPTGPYDITGDLFYSGKVMNPQFIIQACRGRDFGGLPVAQTVVRKTSTTNDAIAGRVGFTLNGLIDGTYYVRAFMDQNNNGVLDAFESRGMVAQANPATIFRAQALVVPPALSAQVLIVRDRDTDNDRLPDAFEMYLVTNLTTMGFGSVRGWTDTDHDGLNDFEEYNESAADSNPLIADTDGDGIPDSVEVMTYGTNPRAVDTDGDGLNDAQEISYNASPLLADTDGDGVPDALEVLRGAKPNLPDTDGDGFPDLIEVAAGTNPNASGSRPGGRDLLEIHSFGHEGAQDRAGFHMAHGIGKIAENLQVYLESSDSPKGPWSQVANTLMDVQATTNTNSAWSVAPTRDPAKGATYYRLRWKLK